MSIFRYLLKSLPYITKTILPIQISKCITINCSLLVCRYACWWGGIWLHCCLLTTRRRFHLHPPQVQNHTLKKRFRARALEILVIYFLPKCNLELELSCLLPPGRRFDLHPPQRLPHLHRPHQEEHLHPPRQHVCHPGHAPHCVGE